MANWVFVNNFFYKMKEKFCFPFPFFPSAALKAYRTMSESKTKGSL